MLRKFAVFFVTLLVINGAYAADAYAAPSVKKLGTTGVSSNAAVKSVPVLPRTAQTSSSGSGTGSLRAKAATVTVGRDTTATATAPTSSTSRLSGVSTIKTVSSGKVGTIGTVQPGTSGVGEIEVVESGQGNYVSDVSKGGSNVLNVTKTRVLYAPVRRANSDNIVGDAEIWIVK